MLKLTARRSEWYPVPQDPSGETRVKIKYLKPGEVAEIEAKTNKITGKQEGEDFHTEIKFGTHERTKKFVVSAIDDWEGFVGINGKPLKCNDSNKLSVLKEFEWFGDFVAKCREELEELVAEEMEEGEKN